MFTWVTNCNSQKMRYRSALLIGLIWISPNPKSVWKSDVRMITGQRWSTGSTGELYRIIKINSHSVIQSDSNDIRWPSEFQILKWQTRWTSFFLDGQEDSESFCVHSKSLKSKSLELRSLDSKLCNDSMIQVESKRLHLEPRWQKEANELYKLMDKLYRITDQRVAILILPVLFFSAFQVVQFSRKFWVDPSRECWWQTFEWILLGTRCSTQ